MSFEKLLGDLEELQKLNKSAPADGAEENGAEVGDADDTAIAAAADEGAAAGGAADGGEGGDGDADAGEGAGEGEEMGKSFRFQLDSGEEVEAVDATDLVKSLLGRVGAIEGAAAEKDQLMQKSLGMAVDLIKSQGEAIALLKSEVARLGSEGRGRKTVVSVAEKPDAGTMTKSEPAGVSGEDFMAKALAAQSAGRISGHQVAIAEASLLKGLAVPAHIVSKVLSQ